MDTSKPPKRPRDMNQLANLVGKIATGEAENQFELEAEPKAAKRGKTRAEKLTAERRSEIAKKAAAARWGKE